MPLVSKRIKFGSHTNSDSPIFRGGGAAAMPYHTITTVQKRKRRYLHD